MAKVSIIIPIYNVEEYLRECMDSVVDQTLEDIEIVCVNDGSTDHSPEILRSYAQKDSRIVLIDKENGGYGHAMNCGLDRASGEYIGIVEPDDFVPVNMYEELYEKAVSHDLDFVKADFYRFKTMENGERERVYNHLSNKEESYNRVFDPSMTPEAIKFIMNTWSGIYRRSFLERYKIRHNETPGAAFQDNGFWFQTFIYAKRAMILDKPYYMNRRDNPNSSVNSREKVYCINQEYDHIRELLMKEPALWERFRYMYWFKKYHNYMGTLRRIAPEYKHEYVLRFAAEYKRAMSRGELKQKVFSKNDWANITSLISDPEEYYLKRIYPASIDPTLCEWLDEMAMENQKLLIEIKKIRSSWTFRIGKGVLFIPGNIKKIISKGRRR